ncbi:ribosomal RNA processing protein 36 homolog [Rhinoderma darwinii]|uniref:ribosomal RNA processing protein 36 homolog n=1 Tax=Rhinoderma darwinii TaxID=43563 RepID=UPI003F6803BD
MNRNLMDKTRPRTDITPDTERSEDSGTEDPEDEISETDTKQEKDQATDFSSMSFEELLRARDKVGSKSFYKSVRESRGGKLCGGNIQADKIRPLEMSSKKPVPFLRKVVLTKKTIQRDPRFDDLSGEFKPEVFEKTYSFLDQIKLREKEVLEKRLWKARNPALREQLTQLLRRMNQQEAAAQQKQRLRERQVQFKRQQRERAQQGKRPFYLKKGDARKLELAQKFQELKKKGKVENFLNKKRKRNSIKDRRRLPSQQS